jgi:hypothetical protein
MVTAILPWMATFIESAGCTEAEAALWRICHVHHAFATTINFVASAQFHAALRVIVIMCAIWSDAPKILAA